MKVRLEARDL